MSTHQELSQDRWRCPSLCDLHCRGTAAQHCISHCYVRDNIKSIEVVFTHPTPATSEGMDRVRTKPVKPPTTQRPPITYAGYADYTATVRHGHLNTNSSLRTMFCFALPMSTWSKVKWWEPFHATPIAVRAPYRQHPVAAGGITSFVPFNKTTISRHPLLEHSSYIFKQNRIIANI